MTRGWKGCALSLDGRTAWTGGPNGTRTKRVFVIPNAHRRGGRGRYPEPTASGVTGPMVRYGAVRPRSQNPLKSPSFASLSLQVAPSDYIRTRMFWSTDRVQNFLASDCEIGITEGPPTPPPGSRCYRRGSRKWAGSRWGRLGAVKIAQIRFALRTGYGQETALLGGGSLRGDPPSPKDRRTRRVHPGVGGAVPLYLQSKTTQLAHSRRYRMERASRLGPDATAVTIPVSLP